jgi:hypothetical protein
MLASPLYFAIFVAAALYLGWRRSSLERRKRQSWESLIGRLQRECKGRELSDHFLWREGLTIGPEETWDRLGGLRGLWSMFRNAAVMMEMAEFAARQDTGIELAVLEALRSDAAQIRLSVLIVVAQCALQQANESARMRAFRAASVYTGMAARMTELMQNHAASALPQFVAAM